MGGFIGQPIDFVAIPGFEISARPGALLYVADAQRWLGGLRSAHVRAAKSHASDGEIHVAAETMTTAMLDPDRAVRVEMIL